MLKPRRQRKPTKNGFAVWPFDRGRNIFPSQLRREMDAIVSSAVLNISARSWPSRKTSLGTAHGNTLYSPETIFRMVPNSFSTVVVDSATPMGLETFLDCPFEGSVNRACRSCAGFPFSGGRAYQVLQTPPSFRRQPESVEFRPESFTRPVPGHVSVDLRYCRGREKIV